MESIGPEKELKDQRPHLWRFTKPTTYENWSEQAERMRDYFHCMEERIESEVLSDQPKSAVFYDEG